MIRLVAGPASVQEDRWVLSLNDPGRGIVATAASPAGEALWGLLAGVHRALGQRRASLTTTPADRRLLPVWLEAYRVSDLIVHHADAYDAEAIAELGRLAGSSGVALWAIVDPSITEAVADELATFGIVDPVPWTEFRARWTSVLAEEQRLTASSPSPRLDAPAAWTAAYERLSRASGRTMDLPYLEGFCAAAGWTRRDRPRKVEVAAQLRACLGLFGDTECFAQAARGVAVALHQLGWAVTLDLRRLAGHSVGEPATRPAGAVRLADARAFRDPLVGATVVLAGLELAPAEILSLTVDDISPNGATVSLWHDTVEVPEVVQPILRAQRIVRAAEGAAGNDPFLVRNGRALSARHFPTVVLAGLEELGQNLPRMELDDRPGADERWLLERGVALQWIPGVDRRTTTPAGMSGAAFLAHVVGRLNRPESLPAAPCACSWTHVPPVSPDPGTWPPPRNHVGPGPDHSWRYGFEKGLRTRRPDAYASLPRPTLPSSGPGSLDEAMTLFLRATALAEES